MGSVALGKRPGTRSEVEGTQGTCPVLSESEGRMSKEATLADRLVGERVRLRRKELGLSQEKLGKAVGVTFQQIQKYENGVNRIGAGRLTQIGSFFYVPVSYFFDGV